MARSFEAIKFIGIHHVTADAYSSMMRVFLAYSALELMSELVFGKNKIHGLIINDKKLVQRIVRTTTFTNFLDKNITNAKLKERFNDVIQGENCNVLSIATVVRHIFAHGKLSAHANYCKPNRIHLICEALADNLFLFMDKEFQNKVNCVIK